MDNEISKRIFRGPTVEHQRINRTYFVVTDTLVHDLIILGHFQDVDFHFREVFGISNM